MRRQAYRDRSRRVKPDFGGFEGEPDFPSFFQSQFSDRGWGHLSHHRDVAVDANANSPAHQLYAGYATRPNIAGAAFGSLTVKGDCARVDNSEDLARLRTSRRNYRSARQTYRSLK